MNRPPPSAAVLPALPAHAGLLAALHAAAFAPPDRWDAAALRALLAQPGVFALVHPDGGMVLARVAADEAEILTLAVIPAARRRGIAATLLQAAGARAAALGAATMFLEVAEGNAAGRALYAAAGYRMVAKRPDYYPDHAAALVLSCPLNRAATAGG